MVSSASDGLVKLWNVREEECIATMDNHEDKVWALAVSSDESVVVSGAADSMITFWQDSTEEEEAEKMKGASDHFTSASHGIALDPGNLLHTSGIHYIFFLPGYRLMTPRKTGLSPNRRYAC